MFTKLMAPMGKRVAKFQCGGSEEGGNVAREFRTAMSVCMSDQGCSSQSVCQCLSYTSTSLSTRAKLCTTLSITKVSTLSKMLYLVHCTWIGERYLRGANDDYTLRILSD